MVPEKGVHLYVEVVASIANDFKDWSFGLIGSVKLGESNKTNSFSNKLIKNFLNIGPQAKFYGFKDRNFVDEKMKKASIIVVPSLWQEPFGLVVAEAMSNGLCIIASKVGGIPEILNDNGVLINDINYKKLEMNLKKLIKNDQIRKDFQKKAWKNFTLTSEASSKKLDNFRKIIYDNF